MIKEAPEPNNSESDIENVLSVNIFYYKIVIW